MASLASFRLLPYCGMNSDNRTRLRVRVQSSGGGDSTALSSDSISLNGSSVIKEREKNGSLIGGENGRENKNGGNGRLTHRVDKKRGKEFDSEGLEALWDDGYGTKTVEDYFDGAKEMIRSDGGPPRWFCPVECGQPLKGSPVLLYLPGIDGVGLGLTLHHKALGKAFEVRCLHIPVHDRTPFEGLVKIVEETVLLAHASSPNKTIYLLGESFGGCLALAVAARNPQLDLVVVLVNPATSFGRSQLQPLLPVLEVLPDELHRVIPQFLGFLAGNPVKMAMANIEHSHPPRLQIEKVSRNLLALHRLLPGFADILPKETFLWRIELLKSAVASVNPQLTNVQAEVLLLARSSSPLLTLLQCFCTLPVQLDVEEGVNLLTVIKGTNKYRRSRQRDYVSDFIPPSMSDYKRYFEDTNGSFGFALGSTFFSTLEDGKIVKGLAGVPNKGPVLLVGYHMLMAAEVHPLAGEFLKEKNVMIRGLAHPDAFSDNLVGSSSVFALDLVRAMGPAPVTGSNFYKLLAKKSHVLLYPGGSRESLHCKGEEYKLFWPNEPEFVRMAAKFGATIVPFGTVGEDDLFEFILDYHDLMKIPIVNDYIREMNRHATEVRDKSKGEVATWNRYVPGILPKVPGRLYFLFGKPIRTKGKEELLVDREQANQLYLHIKSQVESCMAYLLRKREEDPYRSLVDRLIHRAFSSSPREIPTFDP
ncbi:hypothetical protein Tsubulata_015974 [Turnera subulata]|uniref:Serine aminopeptidase S33 domain-containing protein n=1 Tax=Turnera subulata TaxID=218843 RepID=A0A9Q0FJ68_9ROSI|nr:hypothetical protein Tsubulata_015974 [Turnera subulata]